MFERGAFSLGVALVAVLGGAGCARPGVRPSSSPAQPMVEVALRYDVTYVRQPEHALEVEVTREPGAPRDFLFTEPGGVESVRVEDDEGGAREVPVREGRLGVEEGARRLRYRYPLDAVIRQRGPSLSSGLGRGDARMVAGRAWLLRPYRVAPSLRAELVVRGGPPLFPWEPGPGGVYRLRGGDLVDSGLHAFGGRRCRERVSGALMEVALLGDVAHMDDAALCTWLRHSAEEVLTVRRTFPYPRMTVVLVPWEGRDSPALFGLVQWSSPPSIAILVGEQAQPEAYAKDWVAVHEMLHLAHPVFVPRVAWLSEGMATYYTELAKARSGRQTPQEAWGELLAGFSRGHVQAAGRTMEEITDTPGAYLALYWTGALFALHLDMELRRATGNHRGLDDVLERLAGNGPASTLEAFGAAVDEVAGKPLFQSLLARHLRRPAFSELKGLLEALGVEDGGAEGVHLVPARDALLREALTARHGKGEP